MSKEVDKDYQVLMEEYEDALMRLVMYRVAQEDGKRLLQEAQELEESGFEVPKELDEKCLKLIKEGCASGTRSQGPSSEGPCEGNCQRRGLRLHHVVRAAVVALLAAVLLFCAAYAIHEDFRVGVLNFFLELRENGTWFSFQKGGMEDNGAYQPQASGVEGEFPFEFTYIPEGYELIKQKVYDLGSNGKRYYCGYSAIEDLPREFYFDISHISEVTGLVVDTEDAVVTEITIHGHDGWLIEKTDVTSQKQKIKYYWFDLAHGCSFNFSSLGISPEESKKILDGIMFPVDTTTRSRPQ